MAILTKQQLQAENQSSFPDNNTEAITPAVLRAYNSDVIDTMVDSLATGSFVPTDISALNQFTASQQVLNNTFATTGSNTFSGDQTIQSDGTQNGIFYKTGSSEFFVGQRNNGNLVISSSANDRIIDINPQSGWVEHYSQTNFNSGVGLRGLTEARTFTQQAGYVARFEGEFSASLQNGYAWVGNGSGYSQQVPTSSFAGGGTIVGYATTGSNTFVGAQYITEGNPLYFNGANPLQTAQLFPNQLDDKFDFNVTGLSGTKFNNNIYIDGEKRLFIKRSNTGADQYLRLGATDNSYNFAFIVTGSDTNPGQQVWGINTAGGVWANSFDAGVVFNSYVTASNGIRIQDGGTFSAPLQQGYVWVGNSNGRTTTVPTSSFGGGGGSTFPYTGDAEITGSLGVSNSIRVNNEYGGITIAKNPQNSGSFYSNVNVIVDTTTDPTNVFSGVGVSEQDTARNLTLALNSYASQYPGITVPSIIGFYQNQDGSDLAMAFPTNGQMDVWKKSNFKYGADITGSLKVTSTITASLQQGYALVGGSGNRTIAVPTSSFAGGSTINTGSFATTGSNTFVGGQTILAGGINLQENLQGSGSAYGGITTTVDTTTDPSNVYSAYQLVKPGGDNLISIAVNSYTSEYPNTPIPYLFGGGNNPGGTNAGLAFPTDGTAEMWKKTNFKYGADVTGSLKVTGGITGSIGATNGVISGSSQISGLGYALTGSNNTFTTRQNINNNGGYALRVSGSITQDGSGPGNSFASTTTFNGNTQFNAVNDFQSGLNSYGQINIAGAGLQIAANPQGTGSAYSIGSAVVDITTDPTNVYSAWQLPVQNGGDNFGICWNSYTPYYSNATAMIISPGFYNGTDAAIGFPSDGTIEVWKPTTAKANLTVASGSNFYAHGHKQFNGGQFQNNTTLSGSSNVSQSIALPVTDLSYGVSITNSSRITIANAGTYNIQFSAQIETQAGADTVWIWFKKNGNNISDSATKVVLANNTAQTMTVNILSEANANDYYELVWQTLNGNARILSEAASGNIPLIPAVITTVTQVR